MIKKLKFLFVTLSSILTVIYLLVVSYVYFNQCGMVFKATKLASDYKFDYKQNFEELTIPSFDGVKLNGLLFKAENSKGLVFYLHGNAGTLDTWGEIAQKYTKNSYDIFILDYRGFGKSEGTVENEEQIYKDISISYQTLLKKYKEQNVIIVGYSIGTGLASYLASTNNPKKLILQAPYYSLTELSSERMPFIPNFLKKFKFETNVFIPKIKVPVFIFHGNRDQVIGYENSVRLSKLLKKEDQFFTLNNQGHSKLNDNVDFLNQLEIILKK